MNAPTLTKTVTLLYSHRTADTMKKFFLVPAALLALTLPALTGCDNQDNESPSDRVGVQSESARYVLVSNAALSPEDIEKVTKTLEAASSDLTSAQVSAQHERTDDTDQWTITTELSGAQLPGEDVFAKLQQEIPALADASFEVESIEGPSGDHPGGDIEVKTVVETAVKDGASNDDIEDEVVDKLRSQGVEGKIYVDVSNDEDGHKRVEVEVEDTKHEKTP